MIARGKPIWVKWLLLAACFAAPGCQALDLSKSGQTDIDDAVVVRGQADEATVAELALGPAKAGDVARELDMVSLPTYRIEPSDVLLVDAVKLIPKQPYRLESLDVLQIVVDGTLPESPIIGLFPIEPGGEIRLGPAYGSVKVGGLSVDEAVVAIDRHLQRTVPRRKVSASLAQISGQQQILGERLVGADGTLNLGTYGQVFVAGLTLEEARRRLEEHLSKYLDTPKVSIDVFAYNSEDYYVIFNGAGFGDRVFSFPVTGNETVFHALAQVQGLQTFSSKKIWIARPAPGRANCRQILPVNWRDVAEGGVVSTNYQLFPGDRVYIEEDRLVATDNFLSKMIAPFDRAFGFMLLGSQAVQVTQRFPVGFVQGNTPF